MCYTLNTLNSLKFCGLKNALIILLLLLSSSIEATVYYINLSGSKSKSGSSGSPCELLTRTCKGATGYRDIINCNLDVNRIQAAPIILIDYPKTIFGGFVGELDATASYDPENNSITAEWIVPANVPVSGTTDLNIRFLAPIVDKSTKLDFKLNVSNGTEISSEDISITILPYHPELFAAKIADIEASNFILPNIPAYASDDNTGTFWSSDGDNQWLQLRLSKLSEITYLQLDFLREQDYSSYFDIYASKDYLTWDPVLIGAESCNFSGESQIFDFPSEYVDSAYLYIKYIGHGNALNSLNSVSEFKAFGPDTSKLVTDNKLQINIYPNPAKDLINITIKDSEINPDRLIIAGLSGKIMLEKSLSPGSSDLQIPLNLKSGVYVVELLSKNLILITQKIIVIPNKDL